jgi:hypothetical protein
MDKELLELAAKACGLEEAKMRIEFNQWNPIEDDGDALRLAVQLQIIVGRYDNYVNAAPLHDGAKEIVIWSHNEKDPYAATRRAIVRAAAEIGRSMK